ncbi:MAG: ThiF family adenylyltransferase [Acidobacteriota bacterium]
MSESPSRYARQIRFDGIGEAGQERLGLASLAVVGLGALGSVSAGYLARGGVGRLRLIDRDIVEPGNLQRQVLFTESDARDSLPKAVAAARCLQAANSCVDIEAAVADLTATSVDRLLDGVDVVLDGTDNFESRYLINEWSVREAVPWIYGAAVGSHGLVLALVPGSGPCLACVFPAAPPAELSPTCETAGIIGPVAGVVGSWQAGEALKILAGSTPPTSTDLQAVDLWAGSMRRIQVEGDPACSVCRGRRFPHLDGRAGVAATRLCGRDTVQLTPRAGEGVDLDAIAQRFALEGDVIHNEFVVRARLGGHDLAVFADGRVLVSGTSDVAVARGLVARYVGS